MFCWLVSSLKHSAWWRVWIAGVTSACCPVIFSVNTMITVGFNCRCNKCLLSCHFYDEWSMTTVGLNGRKGQVPVVLSFLWWMVHDNSGFEWQEGTGACCPVISMMNGPWQQWVWMAGRDRCLLSCHFYDEWSMTTVGLNGRKGQVPVVLSFLWSTHHDDNGFELYAWWVRVVLSFLWSTHHDDNGFELQVWWVPVVVSFLLLGPASEKVAQSARLCLALWGLWPHGPLCESTFFVWGRGEGGGGLSWS